MAALTVENLGDALLAILALHKPAWVADGIYGGTCCAECLVPVEDEPCATVNIVRAALGGA